MFWMYINTEDWFENIRSKEESKWNHFRIAKVHVHDQ